MKQSEKLDLLLKGMYEEGTDKFCSLGQIVNKYNIPIKDFDEFRRLANRLKNDGYIINVQFTRTDISAQLSSFGIDYCEGSSYTYEGSAIINNTYEINISNSKDTTVVNQSDNVKIISETKSNLMLLIEDIKNDDEIPTESKKRLIDTIKKISVNL